MKIAVYGAGAIGGWMGVRLSEAGHDVSVVARGATLEAIHKQGLRLVSGDRLQVAEVRASESPADLGAQDLVILAVKGPAMTSVAAHISPLLGSQTMVLTAMNGVPWWFCDGLEGELAGRHLASVDPDGRIASTIPSQQTLGCVVHANAFVVAPGTICLHSGNGLIVGEANGKPSARASALAETLKDAGFDASVSPKIQREIWYKLWGNMTMNPMSAITGATTDRLLNDALVRGFATQVMLEAKAIGERFGIPIKQDPEDRHHVTLERGAMRTSMLQDVEARKPVELDSLVGAVRELGQLTSVPTPFTDALFGIARLHATLLGLYPQPELPSSQ